VPVIKDFALPDVGEGLTEADILRWAVQPGDTVVVNQVLVEVETAKAAVELPSPYAGVVSALHVKEGDTVPVGTPIISIDVGGEEPVPAGVAPAASTGEPAEAAASNAETTASAQPATASTATPASVAQVPAASNGPSAERQPVLVGYGPRATSGGRRPRRPHLGPADETVAPSANPAFNVPAVGPADRGRPVEFEQAAAPPPHRITPRLERALAKPPVRKLAKSLGIDLDTVTPTGPNGTVSRADVERAAQPAVDGAVSGYRAERLGTGAETRVPVRGVRKHTAAAMVASAFTAPHVTEFLTVDVTETMRLRDRVSARPEFRGVKVSPLLFVAKAVIRAVQRNPELNAVWDEAAGEIVLKHYVNLGIAVATERGLIVPNVKNADQLSLLELGQAISELTEIGRAGRSQPADMTGGTFTITNVGVFGIDTGTPILTPGESGILAFGAIRRMPWVVAAEDGTEAIMPRWVTQLAVSFDHRLVDGQQGSQFLSDVGSVLNDPGLALL
jgi:2-oxoisovalerate dehydrogenase E2 component (dihydrolipoyl transacylase)